MKVGIYARLAGNGFGENLLVVPILLFLIGAVAFPELQPLVYKTSDFNYLATVEFDCDEWSAAHHRYPTNDLEMQEALRSTMREDTFSKNGGIRPQQESHYRYQRTLVPYQV